MDPIKKRRIDDTSNNNGSMILPSSDYDSTTSILDPDDARKILETLTQDQLSEIARDALLRHHDVLQAARSFADRDLTQRKLFVRGLGLETTNDKLWSVFSAHGELEEAVVILDKATGKSKGYGFVTFRHVDGAILALKDPSKKIDGRMAVSHLAAAGSGGGGVMAGGTGAGGGGGGDVLMRKIYVGNVSYDMDAERLLQLFSTYGEIEEGPLGFDKATGKSKGFALFVYKTAEGARASLVNPVKTIDGHQLNCKLAIDGKKGKPNGIPLHGDGVGGGEQQYDGGHYGGYRGGGGMGVVGSGMTGTGGEGVGSSFGVSGGYGGSRGYGGHGSQYSGPPMGSAYGGMGPGPGIGGGFGGSAGSGAGGPGRRPSLYGTPPSSAGMGSVDYGPSSHYGLSSVYPAQHHQPAPRVPPPGGAFQGMPPYY